MIIQIIKKKKITINTKHNWLINFLKFDNNKKLQKKKEKNQIKKI